MNKQQYHNLVSKIDDNLIGSPYAKNLFSLVVEAAENNDNFRKLFTKWLSIGGTVLLRDEIVYDFKNKFDKLDWFNAWCKIDDTRMNIVYKG